MDLVLRNAATDDTGLLRDIAIADGRIVAVADRAASSGARAALRTIDVAGRVVIPGLVEPHVHLDKALLGPRVRNDSGTLAEALRVTRAAKRTFTRDDIRQRAEATLRLCLSHGVTTLRAQTEFDPELGLVGVEVLLDLKAAYAPLVDVQVVAFPQEGILRAPGTLELFHEALRMGTDVVGGVPYNDTSAEQHIDVCFDLARRYDRPLSFHQDFADDTDAISIEYLARKTLAEGLLGRVEVGHATALGALTPEQLAPIGSLLREADISVVSLPLTDLHLGGRADAHKVRRGLAPIAALLAAGVNVAAGANNIRNAFTPFGTGDPLLTGMLLVPTAHLGGAETLPRVLDLVTRNAARAIGLPAESYGIAPGCTADLVVLDTRTFADAVIDLPARLFTIKGGEVTFSSETVVRQYVFPRDRQVS
ncbi:MAG TPA: amidohydrolase family protein [Chloroflexota bacterium]